MVALLVKHSLNTLTRGSMESGKEQVGVDLYLSVRDSYQI